LLSAGGCGPGETPMSKTAEAAAASAGRAKRDMISPSDIREQRCIEIFSAKDAKNAQRTPRHVRARSVQHLFIREGKAAR
jgi:hypothetical protein